MEFIYLGKPDNKISYLRHPLVDWEVGNLVVVEYRDSVYEKVGLRQDLVGAKLENRV